MRIGAEPPASGAGAAGPRDPAAALEHDQVKTSEAQAAADSKEAQDGLAGFRYFLLGFGGIALFVGSFVIANTLAITVAQRIRELATLRTLGASRRQVLVLGGARVEHLGLSAR